MGVIIPSVPFKSQYDPDAGEFRNDCGPASLAMVLAAFGVNASTNAVYRRTGAKANNYVSIAQLMRAAQSYELVFDYFHAWNVQQLIDVLNTGRVAIALVHYGAWSQINAGISTQNPFTGPHFVTVVGADDKYIYVNDPLWKDNRRTHGFRKAWTHAEFYAAWSSCHLDGNRDCSGILTQAALPVSAYGSGSGPASRQFALDPQTANRIRAWAYFNNAPQPALENPATANAYLTVMGGWGTRVVRHTVVENDDLSMLAFHYYGDGLRWRVILAFNGLEGADAIADGDVLLIPQPLESPLPIPPNRRPSGGVSGLDMQLEKQEAAVAR
jgi:uncharacterized protein YvpB